MSSVRLIFNGRMSMPIVWAAASTSFISNIPALASALTSNASRRRFGKISRKCSRRLAPRSRDWLESPVTFPPGLAKDATRPLPIGSPATGHTIGMTAVACLAASAGSVAIANITSTWSLTNSAAISTKRSGRPSPQRYSILMVRPSIQPSSRSRWTKAAAHAPCEIAVLEPKNPMVGGVPACCAVATSGHATAAPPSSVMNSRRSHSITSSARASSVGGISRPSALAVLRLITSSNRSGAWTGSPLGFSPSRMRSTYDAACRN